MPVSIGCRSENTIKWNTGAKEMTKKALDVNDTLFWADERNGNVQALNQTRNSRK